MALEFSYTAGQPAARIDGSGVVDWFIIPYYREIGDPDWLPVFVADKLVYVQAADLAIVNDMPHDTGPEKVAKGNAYIALVLSSVDNDATPVVGWLAEDLDRIVSANLLSASAAEGADYFISTILGETYPIRFVQ